jgi:hypothetical protein
MADTITVDTLAQALAQSETIGMPARNLAFHLHREYAHDLHELLSYHQGMGKPPVFRLTDGVVRNYEETDE